MNKHKSCIGVVNVRRVRCGVCVCVLREALVGVGGRNVYLFKYECLVPPSASYVHREHMFWLLFVYCLFVYLFAMTWPITDEERVRESRITSTRERKRWIVTNKKKREREAYTIHRRSTESHRPRVKRKRKKQPQL